jgi:hypothetical protein
MLQAGYSPLDHLFRAAGPQTENKLFAMLEEKSKPELVMRALAWIDSENDTARFADWQREQAIALLDFYMFNAGWELDANYQKRWLYSKSCFGLKAASKQTERSDPASLSSKIEKCRWCDRPLFTLKDFPTVYLENIFSLKSQYLFRFLFACTASSNLCPCASSLVVTGRLLDFSPHALMQTKQSNN